MSHSVRRHLAVAIEEYDAAIRRFIPGYEAMLAAAAAEVAGVRPALALDLGAGTGALSAVLLASPRVGAVELVDVDAEMLDQARTRLAPFGARARFSRRSFADPLPPCGAVAASLALHHIPHEEDKEALYRRIFLALEPSGVFVNADVTMPSAGPGRDEAFRGWAAHLVASGIAEEDAWRHFAAWAEEDTYLPLEVELAALERAGFRTRCVWREGVSTVLAAERP